MGSPPPPGSEVYIAKLPRDLYEDTLIPLFQSVGQLYEFRLMLTFSGLNRGFAYAKYSDQHGAGKAIAALNNWEVQEGRAILVCRSFEKCELSVNGLPATLRRRELDAMLLEATEGLLGLTLHASPGRKQGKVAVLTYSSHRAAAMAKKALVEGTGRWRGGWDGCRGLEVGWDGPSVRLLWVSPRECGPLQEEGEGGVAEAGAEGAVAGVWGEAAPRQCAVPAEPRAGAAVLRAARGAGPPGGPVPAAAPGHPPLPHQVRAG